MSSTLNPSQLLTTATLLAAVAGLGAAACGLDGNAPAGCEQQPWSAAQPPPTSIRRVVLLSIDTLRADHLPSYGYARNTAPVLSELAEGGLVFERATASMSHTAPSHASMLTGRSPFGHAVLVNGQSLDASIPSVACLFRANGFRTGAFTSVRFLREIGVGFEEADSQLRAGADTLDRALAWLEGLGPDEPFFLWVHLYDPHEWLAPFPHDPALLERVRIDSSVPHEEFFEYVAELHALQPRPSPAEPIRWVLTPQKTFEVRTPAQFVDYVDRYDALIAYADAQAGRLRRAVERTGLPGASLWIVTSDHGEGVGSHGIHGHGQHIYDEQLRVPLIFYSSDPDLVRRGTRFGGRVALVDLLPTLAELFGTTPPDASRGLEGRSLAPVLRGEAPRGAGAIAFAQRRPVDPMRLEAGWSDEDVYAAISDRHKYIHRTGSPDEFFDLATDPNELRNLADVESPEREALKLYLDGKLADLGVESGLGGRTSAAEIPEDLAEELRALGYME